MAKAKKAPNDSSTHGGLQAHKRNAYKEAVSILISILFLARDQRAKTQPNSPFEYLKLSCSAYKQRGLLWASSKKFKDVGRKSFDRRHRYAIEDADSSHGFCVPSFGSLWCFGLRIPRCPYQEGGKLCWFLLVLLPLTNLIWDFKKPFYVVYL